jgi:hypothetical protein
MRSLDSGWFNVRAMELDIDAFVLCEHAHERGECELCDDVSAHLDRPIERLRESVAEHPEVDEVDYLSTPRDP